MFDDYSFAPQGWQCPICKRVYSPMTPMCYSCGNFRETITTHYTATPTTLEEFVKRYGKTPEEILKEAEHEQDELH